MRALYNALALLLVWEASAGDQGSASNGSDWSTTRLGDESSPLWSSSLASSPFLNELLRNVEKKLPEISFELPLPGGSHVRGEVHLKCDNVHVGAVGLSWENHENDIEITFQAEKVALDCTGVIKYAVTGTWEGSGEFGVEVFTTQSALRQKWSLYWNRIPYKKVDRSRHIPVGISTKACKVHTGLDHDSFRVIGGVAVLSFLDEQVLNTFAPLFGPLVIEPLACLLTRTATTLVSFGLDYTRSKLDWLLHKRLPEVRPHTVQDLEIKVRPRSPSSDVIVVNNTAVRMASDFVRDLLASPVPVDDDKGDTTLGVNQLLREKVLSKGIGSEWVVLDEALSIFNTTITNIVAEVTIDRVAVRGMDSFQTLNIAEARGSWTLGNRVSFNSPLQVVVHGALSQKPSERGQGLETTLPIDVYLMFDNLNIGADILVGVDRVALQHLNIGSLQSDPVQCILSALANVSIANVDLAQAFQIRPPKVEGVDGLVPVFETMAAIVTHTIIQPVVSAIKDNGSALLQSLAQTSLQPLIDNAACPTKPWPPPHQSETDPPLDWSHNVLLTFASYILNTIMGSTGQLRMNKVISWSLAYIFGNDWAQDELHFPHPIAQIAVNLSSWFPFLGLPTTVEVTASNLAIKGLSELSNFYALEPNHATCLKSNVSVSEATISADIGLQVKDFRKAGGTILDNFTLNLALSPEEGTLPSLLANIGVALDPKRLDYLELGQLLSSCIAFPLQEPPTQIDLYSKVRAPVFLRSLEMTPGLMSISGQCKQCTSPSLESIFQYIENHADRLQDTVRAFLPVVEHIARNATDIQSYFGGANVNFATNYLVALLNADCVGDPLPPERRHRTHHPYQRPWWIPQMDVIMAATAVTMLLGFTASVVLASKKSTRLRKTQTQRLASTLLETDFLNTGGSQSAERVTPASHSPAIAEPLLGNREFTESTPTWSDGSNPRQVVQDFRQRVLTCEASRHSVVMSPREVLSETDALYLIGHDRAMIVHPCIGTRLGLGVAAVLVVISVLFISGNYFSMGRIVVVLELAGDRMKEIPIIDVTTDYCVDKLSEAGALVFFVYLGAVSGLLPWVRVAFLLYAWVAPANVLTVPRRGYLLTLMESLGKWIMSIFFLVTVTSSMMTTTVLLPPEQAEYSSFLPPRSASVYIEYVPNWGLDSFFLAAFSSAVLNQFILAQHRKIVKGDNHAMQGGRSSAVRCSYHNIPRGEAFDERDESRLHADENTGSDEEHSGDGFSLDARGTTTTLSHETSRAYTLRDQSFGEKATTLGLLLWPVVLYFAFTTKMFELELLGMAGFVTQYFGNPTDQKVRIDSIISLIPGLLTSDPAGMSGVIGSTLILVAYLLIVILAPVFGMVTALILWFAPLSPKRKGDFLALFRMFNSWNATNVLCTTLFVMSLEMHPFVKTIIGGLPFCFPELGESLLAIGASEAEGVCMGLESYVLPGWVVLLFYICYSFVFSRAMWYYVRPQHKFELLLE